jgi:hypothetical protein
MRPHNKRMKPTRAVGEGLGVSRAQHHGTASRVGGALVGCALAAYARCSPDQEADRTGPMPEPDGRRRNRQQRTWVGERAKQQ